MSGFWHPVSALFLADPPMPATSRILKMLLTAADSAELVYAGDRMHPNVRHGARVRVESLREAPLREGEVVVAAFGSAIDLLRVVRSRAEGVVLGADADPELAESSGGAIIARARLPVVRVGNAARRLARMKLDVVEAWSGRLDAASDPSETVREKYHSQAAHYAWRDGEPIEASLAERIRASVRPGGRILVAGCGSGREAIALARAGYGVRGVDFAPAMVEACRDRARSAGVDASFLEADLRRHVEPEASLDAVFFTYDVYSFVPRRDERIAILRAMERALAPGGIVLLSARRRRDRWGSVMLGLQRLCGSAAAFGDSHTRWIGPDGAVHRSYVRLFGERELAAEIDEGGFDIEPCTSGHVLLRPRAGSRTSNVRMEALS